MRTIFLLRYITDAPLRATITATTNKAESFNALADWIFFGGKGVIAHNDPDDQEKCIKYLDVVANALILSNTAQVTRILRELSAEGVPINKSDVARLSPYFTEHVLRFGEFVIDPDELFANLLENTALPDQIMSQIDWSPPD
ncbi:MAG: transposase [Anaerolineae bacterium]|nr:transposase [Anaerolineae bacterium]